MPEPAGTDARVAGKRRAWFRRPGLLALLLLCLGLAASVETLRELDKPWRRPASRVLFPDGSDQMGFLEKVARPWVALQGDSEAARAARDRMEVPEWVQLGLWYGAAGFSLLLLALVLGFRWWHPWTRHQVVPGQPGWRAGWQAGWKSRALLLLALGLAGATRLPCLDRAILWDEQDNLRRSFHGYSEYLSLDEAPVWREATLRDALWENRRGNNPAMMSVLAQLSNQCWRAVSGAPRERFHPVALRLPVAVAGLAGIAALWWMTNVLGWRQAAPVAALLAALHPMHAEYTVQARGYGFVLLSVPVAIGAAWLAWRRGAWRDFWLFGLALLAGLWAFPGSVYFAAATGLALAAALAWRGWSGGDPGARAGLARLVVCGLLAAGGFAWLMGPYIPQMLAYLGDSFQRGHMPTWWYLAAYLMYASGLMFLFPQAYFLMEPGTSPPALAWVGGEFFVRTPWLAVWSLVLVPVFLAAGWAVWWRRRDDRMAVLLAAATAAAALLCLVHSARSGQFIYGWYVIFALPVALALMAQGMVACGARLARHKQGGVPRWTIGAVAAFLVYFTMLTHPAVPARPYDLGETTVFRRPLPTPWFRESPRHIGRAEFQRANNLWVVYEDGVHVVFHAGSGKSEKAAALIQRLHEAETRR